MIDSYITFMFWFSVFGQVIYAARLVGEHPRPRVVTVGEDTLSFIIGACFLAWLSAIKFWS